jgi:hypothetical protein
MFDTLVFHGGPGETLETIMRTPKGVGVSGLAVQEPGFTAVTLLGLIQTTEGPTGGAANAVR